MMNELIMFFGGMITGAICMIVLALNASGKGRNNKDD